MKYIVFIIIFTVSLTSCSQNVKKENNEEPFNVSFSEIEWKEKLSKEQYYVLRQQGTEAAFSGEYWNNYDKGKYVCAACNIDLFNSEAKFKSGTGWPSYFTFINGGVKTSSDRDLGYVRTEVHCANCGGHLGHVFNDGPKPTGLRYCVNSISLKFIPE